MVPKINILSDLIQNLHSIQYEGAENEFDIDILRFCI